MTPTKEFPMTMPQAVFGGLALIAVAISYAGSQSAHAVVGGVQKIAICNESGRKCAKISQFGGLTTD
jgi:hypothetical protein